jgi:predicted transcriptional regulator
MQHLGRSGEAGKPLSYNGVMTTLDRLYRKGLLSRRRVNRAFMYSLHKTRRAGDAENARSIPGPIVELAA